MENGDGGGISGNGSRENKNKMARNCKKKKPLNGHSSKTIA